MAVSGFAGVDFVAVVFVGVLWAVSDEVSGRGGKVRQGARYWRCLFRRGWGWRRARGRVLYGGLVGRWIGEERGGEVPWRKMALMILRARPTQPMIKTSFGFSTSRSWLVLRVSVG